ncbi:hypothetical protein VOLCADRAFT_97197 [Volvox carteri f. nagariensis]|uniref:Uncharacterized protein n=1 Tax=Volvox carteri f. nagariensis TaxID=3068 RepID=D8UC45_VOLCA|nr:uncharacterized protein VOLCADRAFT_97197 [Volvox carteri f. nagariensis]EFJ42734.1 hypothetical protein VOLCADRAFT_97197 [Volvox carteri f. nagariensis]|eukprot:XP_002956195.1 hypothetical protein VOLCADRAFT_97197 [Volvox carteri f. nagariensis]
MEAPRQQHKEARFRTSSGRKYDIRVRKPSTSSKGSQLDAPTIPTCFQSEPSTCRYDHDSTRRRPGCRLSPALFLEPGCCRCSVLPDPPPTRQCWGTQKPVFSTMHYLTSVRMQVLGNVALSHLGDNNADTTTPEAVHTGTAKML